MNRAIADKSRTMRIPVHMFEKLKTENQLDQEFQQVSIEEFAFEDQDGYSEYFLFDDFSLGLDERLDESMLRESIDKALCVLREKDKSVIRLRFGLDDGYEHTLEEIGELFNVTRERIRQIEEKSLRKLRHPSRVRILKGYL